MQTEALNSLKLSALLDNISSEKLPKGDPRLALASGIRAGEIASAGTMERRFLGLCQQSIDNFSLLDLPPDVAQAILDSRAKSMQEFFDSWSESIRENAKRDKESHKRYVNKKKDNASTFDPAKARRNLRLTLTKAKDAGHIDTAYWREATDALQPFSNHQHTDGLDRKEQEKLLSRLEDIGERLAKLSHQGKALTQPNTGGVSLRSSNKV